MKVGVFVRVDEEVWRGFKQYVIRKHGKLHGTLGDELAEALLRHIQEETHTQSDPKDCIDAMHSRRPIPNKRDNQSKISKDIGAIVEAMRGVVSEGGRLPERVLHMIISRATSRYDRRSLNSRVMALMAHGVIEPDWRLDGVYIVKNLSWGWDDAGDLG
jgi:hypothetical protein